MSRVFKASKVNVDANNRVLIKKMEEPTWDNSYFNHNTANNNEEFETEEVEEPSLEDIRGQAEEILNEANETASKILAQAEEQAKSALEESEKAGYEKGYETGYNEGKEKIETELAQKREEMDALKESILIEKQETISAVEPEIVKVIEDILDFVFEKALTINPELLLVLIRRGLKTVKEDADIKIRISNEAYDEFHEKGLDFNEIFGNVDVLKDNFLDKNECIIETEVGFINCGLDANLDILRQNLNYLLETGD